MSHFIDLSTYEYSDSEAVMLNVGWLAEGYEFPKGDVPEGLLDALLELAQNKVNVYRGMHFCDFCPTFEEAQNNVSFRDVFIGSGEVHVNGSGGRIYAAPAMIVHYVADHGYRPPREFIDAVLRRVEDA